MGTALSNAAELIELVIPEETLNKLNPFHDPDARGRELSGNKKQKKMIRAAKPLFRALNMKDKDIQKWLDAYVDVDLDGVGHVNCQNFCEFFHIERNSFFDKMFFHDDIEKPMKFMHFVVSVYYYCACGPEELAKHIFRLYDKNNYGKIYESTAMKILRDIYDKEFRHEPHVTTAVVNILNIPDRDWGINADQFSQAVAEHLGPAMVLQRDIKKGMLVSMYWRKLSKHGKYNSPLTFKEAREKMEILQAEYDEAEQADNTRAAMAAAAAAAQEAKQKALDAEKRRTGDQKKVSALQEKYKVINAQKAILTSKEIGERLEKWEIRKLREAHEEDDEMMGKNLQLVKFDENNNKVATIGPATGQTSKKDTSEEDAPINKLVRPKDLKIHKQYIPNPIGGDGASNAELVVRNFGNMINGRDLSALVAALKDDD